MYNYYLDLKRKKQIEEVKKNEEKKKILKKKHDKKLLEYTKNYENRIKNFIYQMAEKPILLKEQKELFSTTREKLLNEESDKILFNKGFVFHFNRAERDKGTFYRKETEGLKDLADKVEKVKNFLLFEVIYDKNPGRNETEHFDKAEKVLETIGGLLKKRISFN